MTLHRFILSAATVFLCAGCVEPIILDPEEEMPLVVNCVLDRPYEWWMEMDDWEFYEGYPEGKVVPTQYVDLVRAKRPSETEVQKIDDANVSIIDGRGQVHEFKWNGDRYECTFLPRYGMAYWLEITTSDKKTLRATTTFPARVRLQSVPVMSMGFSHSYSRYFYSEMLYENRTIREIAPGYQQISISWEYRPFLKPYTVWVSASEGSDEPGIPIMTNHPEADGFNVIGGDWPTENSRSFQEDDFYKNHHWGGYPGYTGQVVNEDILDALWTLYNDAWAQSSAHDRFVRIHQTGEMPSVFEKGTTYSFNQRDGIDSRMLFLLNAEFDYEKVIADHLEIKYLCRFVSDEYDRFLRDVAGKFLVHGDEFASYYSEDPVYSNITGGKGIFGAVSHTLTYINWR